MELIENNNEQENEKKTYENYNYNALNDDKDEEETFRKQAIIRSLSKRSMSSFSSTAGNVKKKLENQIKTIIKIHDKENDRISVKSARHPTSFKVISKEAINHSFKYIELVPINSFIEPTDLKDPKASAEAKIPIINTKYNVKILKKPQSMIWLRTWRLSLFLQSTFYNEYKIAKLLSHCKLNSHGNYISVFKCFQLNFKG